MAKRKVIGPQDTTALILKKINEKAHELRKKNRKEIF